MSVEFVDFKTIKLESDLDTTMGEQLNLKQSGKVTCKLPDEWNGYALLYLMIGIHDETGKYFNFDITTETVIKLPDDVKEFTQEYMNEGLEIAQAKTFEAVRAITVAMGINELDLSAN